MTNPTSPVYLPGLSYQEKQTDWTPSDLCYLLDQNFYNGRLDYLADYLAACNPENIKQNAEIDLFSKILAKLEKGPLTGKAIDDINVFQKNLLSQLKENSENREGLIREHLAFLEKQKKEIEKLTGIYDVTKISDFIEKEKNLFNANNNTLLCRSIFQNTLTTISTQSSQTDPLFSCLSKSIEEILLFIKQFSAFLEEEEKKYNDRKVAIDELTRTTREIAETPAPSINILGFNTKDYRFTHPVNIFIPLVVLVVVASSERATDKFFSYLEKLLHFIFSNFNSDYYPKSMVTK